MPLCAPQVVVRLRHVSRTQETTTEQDNNNVTFFSVEEMMNTTWMNTWGQHWAGRRGRSCCSRSEVRRWCPDAQFLSFYSGSVCDMRHEEVLSGVFWNCICGLMDHMKVKVAHQPGDDFTCGFTFGHCFKRGLHQFSIVLTLSDSTVYLNYQTFCWEVNVIDSLSKP